MGKLPASSGRVLISAFEKSGFEMVRQKGSHVSLRKGSYRTVVPLHGAIHSVEVRLYEFKSE